MIYYARHTVFYVCRPTNWIAYALLTTHSVRNFQVTGEVSVIVSVIVDKWTYHNPRFEAGLPDIAYEVARLASGTKVLRDGRAIFSHNIIILKCAEPGGAELSHGGAVAPLKIG